MTRDRRVRIEAAIADHEARAVPWTNQTIYQAVGGNYSELAQYLKERRATEGAAGPVRAASVPRGETPAASAPIVPVPPQGYTLLGFTPLGVPGRAVETQGDAAVDAEEAASLHAATRALTHAQAEEHAWSVRVTHLRGRQREARTALRLLRSQQGYAQDRATRTRLGARIEALEAVLGELEEEAADLAPVHEAANERLIEAQHQYRHAQLTAHQERRAQRLRELGGNACSVRRRGSF